MGGTNKNRSTKSRDTQTDKDIVQSTYSEEASSQTHASSSHDTSVAHKLDTLLTLVKDIGKILKEQHNRHRKHEESTSLHNMSVVLSTLACPSSRKERQPNNLVLLSPVKHLVLTC